MKPLLLLLIVFSISASAQQLPISSNNTQPATQNALNGTIGCLTDVLNNRLKQQTPGYAVKEAAMNNAILNFSAQNRGGSTLVIPIVVHIIHNNGVENISDEQVLIGINDLNTAFSNTGYFTSANGVNTNIQFCLAKQDPDGNFTTGITRTVSTLTDMTAEIEDLALKNLVRWDPTRYLNIWLVREINSVNMGSGVAGYAYFPSAHGSDVDGIVNEAAYFGGTVFGPNTGDNSKIHVHEVGHYLGLYHTFEGGCPNNNCQVDGDRVCDTPPDNSTAAFNCYSPSPPNTCSTDDDDLSTNNPFRPIANGGLGDQEDMTQNYMDYGYQVCQFWFTQGQSTRMNAALTTTRASLLQSTACNSLCNNPLSSAFAVSDTTVFPGQNITCNALFVSPNANYTWLVNGMPAGTGLVYNFNTITTGSYTITFSVTNAFPECATSSSFMVYVVCPVQAAFTLSPGGPYPVGSIITTNNTSAQASTYKWVLDGVLQSTNTNFSQQFNAPGGHNLFLVGDNGLCNDTSATAFFTIGNCNLSGMNQHFYFNNLSLNFNNGNGDPTVGSSPIVNAGQESTTTISDVNGNLLFYSDGLEVYNRNNVVMPNGSGLLGNRSSTQSCLVTPYPGNPNWYYLFTNDAVENNMENGIRYNIIDMTLNNGLGDVIPTKKNIPIRNDVGEMMTGTIHANGRDIWIAMRKRFTNTYFAYLLTDQGISANPVTSIVGVADNTVDVGGAKFSADGNMFATCLFGTPEWSVLLANFNKTTGEFTNGRNIWLNSVPLGQQVHNFEFSPDNSKLYCTLWNDYQVWQYDLAAGDLAAIAASKTVIGPYPFVIIYGQLTRGNNGKIYLSSNFGTLDYIDNPNAAGLACNYVQGTIPSNTNNNVCLSMPNMLQGLGQPYIPSIAGKTTICPNETVTYNVPYLAQNATVNWFYTGNGIFTPNGSTATLSNASGQSTLRVVVNGNCGFSYDTIQINQVPTQLPILGNDTTVCGDIQLIPQQTFAHYLWNTGDIGTILLATPPGTYWVETTDINGCVARDSITLIAATALTLDLGNDTSACNTPQIILDAGPGYQSYEWQDGSDSTAYVVTQPGTYWVSVSDGCATGHDTINVSIGQGNININLNYNGDTVVCKNALPFTLSAPSGYQSYFWQNGNTSPSVLISSIGTYYVTVTDSAGCSATDTLKVLDCTSITENSTSVIKIFPNPVNNTLQLELGNSQPIIVSILNAAGQVVIKQQVLCNTLIDTSILANGLFLVELANADGIVRKKLMVIHLGY